MSTDKRVVLVTGANKGIGYEAVKHIAQRIPSGTVLLGTRSISNGESAITKMRDSVPDFSFDNVKLLQLDIASSSSLSAAVQHVQSTYGKLDVLLHNSGISNVDGDWMHPGVLDLNVRQARDTVLAFLPLIPKGQAGLIDVVSSEVGAWFQHDLGPDLLDIVDNPDKTDWETVESLMDDWLTSTKDSSKAKYKWPTTEHPMHQVYCASKFFETAWVRNFAKTHSEYRVVLTTPGYCATDLNHNSGPRPASQGGASVAWPLFNEFENGILYMDGGVQVFSEPLPAAHGGAK